MKYMSPTAVSVLCSAAALVAVTACSSHKAPANVKPAAQSSANVQSAVAGQAWETPASIKGKTFSFAAPYSLRYNSRLGTFRDDGYTTDSVAWHWGNNKRIEKDNGVEYSIRTFGYKKTGPQTATLDTSLAEGMHQALHKDFVARHYELKFETPTSGTCTLEVTGHMCSLGADKYTATGRFTLK